jgi:nicotinamidase-related amidase/gamma-glutamylcyclotransferase (GGCT)/AIG2-like uncharacterized protein YtfP
VSFELFVSGGLMRGLPYHKDLFDAKFLREVRTAPRYRLHSIADWHPGMYEVEEGGAAIEGELYRVASGTWPLIDMAELPDLYRGKVTLEDGSEAYGILYPRALAEGEHPDITHYGGWRAYLREKASGGTSGLSPVMADPYPFPFRPASAALLVIDMQRDFLDPGGFGAALGNDVRRLQSAVAPIARVLEWARRNGLLILHTREGHRPDLTDCPPAKWARGNLTLRIGDEGPMGRLLIRGAPGHDFIPELRPLENEVVLDKPGKGAFYATDLEALLRNRSIRQILVTGVTTEVCVQSTVREANDRGYDCLVLEDCVASYLPELHAAALAMVRAQGGIFGWVSDSERLFLAIRARPGGYHEIPEESPRPANGAGDGPALRLTFNDGTPL